MNRLVCAFTAAALAMGSVIGGAEAQQAPATNDPGIGASAAERFYGELGTAIPVEVPGYHGIAPQLALNYHSGGPDGFVGVGWSLGGMSVIQRASPGNGSPRYAASDIFLLDGLALVSCVPGSVSPSCTTGNAPGLSYYSTKIESYARIAFSPTTDTWTVWSQDGTATTYGPVERYANNTFRWGIQSVRAGARSRTTGSTGRPRSTASRSRTLRMARG